MPTKEFREFFLRNVQVLSGAKKDQQSNYPTTILVNGIKKFNRFLKNNFPSEDVFTKLFESVTFKLNQEDTASTTVQGLVKKSTDTEAESRTLNPNSDFSKSIVPHQLPELVTASDGSDTVIATSTNSNIKITTLRRTISGLFRRNYMIEAIGIPQGKYLDANFVTGGTTPTVVGAGSNFLRAQLISGGFYKFEALIFTDPAAGGQRVTLGGTATAAAIIWETTYSDDTSNQIDFKERKTALNSMSVIPGGLLSGVLEIRGTIRVGNTGNLDFMYSTSAGGTATIRQGSSITVQEIIR